MNKEEILEKSRKENKNQDLVELEAASKANDAALRVGILVCCVISLLRSVLKPGGVSAVWIVYFSVLAANMFVKFFKLRKRYELVGGVTSSGLSILFLVLYLRDLLGVS